MFGLENDLLRIGIEIVGSLLFLYPSIKYTQNAKAQYKSASENYDLVQRSINTKNFVSNLKGEMLGVVEVDPKKGSTLKSFKYTYYAYEPETHEILKNVSGSYFYGTINEKKLTRKCPTDAKIDLKSFTMNRKILNQQKIFLSPKNVWSDLVDSSSKKGFTLDNEFSLKKINLTFKLVPMAIFAEIKIDQQKNITKILPKFIANSFAAVQEYYEDLKYSKFGSIILGGLWTAVILYVSYRIFQGEFKTLKNKILANANRKPLNADYVLSDPVDKLYCKVCKTRYSNQILNCTHLSICEECYLQSKECPQCGKISEHATKIFL